MKIHFLGTAGYHPNERRHTMSVMIPELGIIFDAGTGMFRAGDLIATPNVDIFLSHAHLDHVVGLTFLFDILQGKDVKVRVVAEEEKLQAVKEHLFSPLLFPVQPPFESAALENQKLSEGWMQVGKQARCRWFPLTHPGGSVGFRLELADGRSLAYVTDTTTDLDSPYLAELENVDLLIHECYFQDGATQMAQLTGHSCLGPVIASAKKVKAKRLALVHLNPLEQCAPSIQQAKKNAGHLNVTIPEDGSYIDW